jgi:hypothetical protein
MQGHGYASYPPRRPSTGVLVLLRVIFVAVAVLSIGFLAWVAPLRAAIVTRRPADWWVFGGSLAMLVVSFSFLATDHTDDFSTVNGNVGMIILLVNAAACVAFYLYTDIRHFRPYPPGYPPVVAHGANYGYPQPPSPYAATVPQPPAHPTPAPAPAPPFAPGAPGAPGAAGALGAAGAPAAPGVPVAPGTPVPPPPPHRPAPARIDQVRAELDELSDYLRRHPGGSDGAPEGGR